MSSQVHYLPLTPGLFSILVLLFVVLLILIQLRILRYVYMRLGIGPGMALLLLFGSLIGSYFNIPITVLAGPAVKSGQIVEFFGMRYIAPVVVAWPGTVLAINVGGAGTFDGIFLTGILAVLLAGVASPSRPPRPAW